MLTVGLYYDVIPGRESEFESMFGGVVEEIGKMEGFVSALLYKRVDQPNSYLIYSEWKDMESFERLIRSKEFSDVKTGGSQLLMAKPHHKIYNVSGK